MIDSQYGEAQSTEYPVNTLDRAARLGDRLLELSNRLEETLRTVQPFPEFGVAGFAPVGPPQRPTVADKLEVADALLSACEGLAAQLHAAVGATVSRTSTDWQKAQEEWNAKQPAQSDHLFKAESRPEQKERFAQYMRGVAEALEGQAAEGRAETAPEPEQATRGLGSAFTPTSHPPSMHITVDLARLVELRGDKPALSLLEEVARQFPGISTR